MLRSDCAAVECVDATAMTVPGSEGWIGVVSIISMVENHVWIVSPWIRS